VTFRLICVEFLLGTGSVWDNTSGFSFEFYTMSNSIVCDDHIIQDLNKLPLHLIKFL
jgi:hypothetical protein